MRPRFLFFPALHINPSREELWFGPVGKPLRSFLQVVQNALSDFGRISFQCCSVPGFGLGIIFIHPSIQAKIHIGEGDGSVGLHSQVQAAFGPSRGQTDFALLVMDPAQLNVSSQGFRFPFDEITVLGHCSIEIVHPVVRFGQRLHHLGVLRKARLGSI